MGKKASESTQVERTKENPHQRTSFDENAAKAICERLSDGESLRSICKTKGMPSLSTVMRRLADDEEFRKQYAHAREVGLDALAEEALAIADEPVGSVDNGGTDSGAVAKQRLQVDTRKWYLSKLAPKKYGERTQVEHTGKVTLENLIVGDGE